ncbi:hypothetical protein RBSH_03515 [Rhodopirellula baltica SH28]|uniref:Uncharacterized protein n=1 Tax=Rhodopirellula baltica SH28 TaxID=993517 RepID=K5E5W0_RHOBT|nr:hypothetical protein RBSH_03515 [Rhodopirellula baltica SH28]
MMLGFVAFLPMEFQHESLRVAGHDPDIVRQFWIGPKRGRGFKR